MARKGQQKSGEKRQKREYTVSSKVISSRRERMGLPIAHNEEEKSYNARTIDHIMRIHEIASHADKSDLLSLKSCFIAYIQLCQEDGYSISNLAAYSAMGFNSRQAFDFFSKRDDPEIREFVGFVRSTCSMFRESLVADNKINPVIGIFWQRNYDGLRNDTEQAQDIENQEDVEYGNTSYKERYKKLISG